MDILFVLGGLVLLFLGGEGLINGSVTIAAKLNLSTLLVSTVIVGFGTSTPELLVSLQAMLQDSSDIALGNVVGSNISNTLLVLGVAAFIASIPSWTSQIRRDVIMGVAAAAFLALLSLSGFISRFSGISMFTILIFYLSYNIWSEKRGTKQNEKEEKDLCRYMCGCAEKDIIKEKMSFHAAAFLTIISFFFLIVGARLLVSGAVSIAQSFGVSEAVIGLTLVALGTSLPELVTAIVASLRKQADVIIGNVLGSNLFNILGILGITAFIKPITVSGRIAEQDIWIMLTTAALLVYVTLSGKKIDRIEGGMLLALYTGYVFWLYFFNEQTSL